jgi:hypothetical protein
MTEKERYKPSSIPRHKEEISIRGTEALIAMYKGGDTYNFVAYLARCRVNIIRFFEHESTWHSSVLFQTCCPFLSIL